VAPFREADAARIRHLDREECHRLVNACPEPLRRIVRGGLVTGARYGELARMRVGDFHRDSGTLLVRQSKAGKLRHVELTTEGLGFFHGITAERSNTEFLFHREGESWGKSHQQRPLVEACLAARITAAISFHALRHTYASLMVMDGVPLIVVARNLGHSDTRMVEKHYGHLTSSYIREAIRSAKAIGIGAEEAKIVPLVVER
jgi:integrase